MATGILEINHRFAALLTGSVLLLLAPPARAQSITGAITGSVRDATNLAIPGAAVTLVDMATGAQRRAASNDQGDFVITGAPPGRYRLMVQFQGFKTLERGSIQLTASERLALGNLVLEIGTSEQKVTVTAEGASVQTASAEHSAVVTNAQVNNLLVRDRQITSLLRLLPGVVDTSEGASGAASGNYNTGETISKFFYLNVQGNRQNANHVTLDGLTLNHPGDNTQLNVVVGIDAVSEVKVLLSGYQAEYGHQSGASIQLIAKSGTRDFHGMGSYYKRHEQFNANGFFNNRLGVGKPKYRFNIWNYNAGGPLYIPGRFNRNRDKMFFFWSQEFWPQKMTTPLRQMTVPTERERAGDFSGSVDQNGALIRVIDPTTGQQFPGNLVPANRVDPNGQVLLKMFPAPNFLDRSVSAGRYNYVTQIAGETPNDVNSFKSDYHISPKDILSFTWSAHRRREEGYATRSSVSWPMVSLRIKSRSLLYTGRYQHIFSPGLINELTLGQNDHRCVDTVDPDQYARIRRDTLGFKAAQFNPAANPDNLVPDALFGGVVNAASIAFSSRWPLINGRKVFNFGDNLTKIVSSHTLKFGVFVERTWTEDGPARGGAPDFNGTIDFGRNVNNPLDTGYAYSNAILGVFNSYKEASISVSPQTLGFSTEWFAQDNWKVSRRLTLDYGIRFYWYPPYHVEGDRLSGFVMGRWDPARQVRLIEPAVVNGKRVAVNPVDGAVFATAAIGSIAPGAGDPANGMVVIASDKSYPRGLATTRVQLAPRFGFAFDPFADGKSALRGGFGMFYNRNASGTGYGNMSQQYPIVSTTVINFDTLATYRSATGLQYPQAVQGFTRDLQVPLSMNVNLSYQRNVGFGTVVDVGYIGTLGRHLMWQRDLNPVAAGARFDPKNADPTNPRVPLTDAFLRRMRGYNDIGLLETASSSSYHSLQVSADRRFARSLQFGANWTWSKAMDFNDGDGGSVSVLMPIRVWDYGVASFDRTHVVKLNWIWDLPRTSWRAAPARLVLNGWQVSGIVSFVSGTPTTVNYSTTTAVDITGTPTQSARIVVTGNPVLPKSERSFNRNFRTEVFRLPAVGTFGNAARTLLRGPGVNNWDLSMFKNFPIRERANLQFRWELYNVFNHTQFRSFDTSARFDPRTGAQVNAGLGQFTDARNPRIMQFALRVTF